MNEIEPLEERLRSWKPRPPKAEVRDRLFGTATSTSGVDAYAGLGEWFTLRWLAPAMASLAVAMLTFAQAEPRLGGFVGGPPNAIEGATNDTNFSARLPLRFDRDPATFDFPESHGTNLGASLASVNLGPLFSLVTNRFKN